MSISTAFSPASTAGLKPSLRGNAHATLQLFSGLLSQRKKGQELNSCPSRGKIRLICCESYFTSIILLVSLKCPAVSL